MSNALVYARIPMPGYNGRPIDRGEVFQMQDCRNDEKLIGLRYVLPYDSKLPTHACPKCNHKFVAENFLINHKKKVDCFADPGVPTRVETAELIGVDVDKIRIEE